MATGRAETSLPSTPQTEAIYPKAEKPALCPEARWDSGAPKCQVWPPQCYATSAPGSAVVQRPFSTATLHSFKKGKKKPPNISAVDVKAKDEVALWKHRYSTIEGFED